MAKEKLAQEHMEKMAHQEDSCKENVVDTQWSNATIAQVNTSHLEDSNSEVQPFTISSKCKYVKVDNLKTNKIKHQENILDNEDEDDEEVVGTQEEEEEENKEEKEDIQEDDMDTSEDVEDIWE